MRWTIAATLIALGSMSALAIDCPPGAYPWVGRRAIEYCKRDVYGPPEGPAAKRVESCPAGARLTDRGGVRACKPLKNSSR